MPPSGQNRDHKEIAEYDFTTVENIPKTTILELAQGEYLGRAENLILAGNSGLGKTHLGIGLAFVACWQGKHVCFYKAAAFTLTRKKEKDEYYLSS